MIQRKQTVFLLLAAVLAVVCLVARWEWIDILQGLSAVLSGYTIFIYKKRPLQAKLCLVTILIHFAWYIALAALIHQGKADQNLPIVACFPLIAAILCFMARKAILADERLVRAADRIR